jgi:formate--tetrahydrofolate ligase
LGAEKFFDIKCRIGDLKPNAVVLVATVRALKHHGGCPKEELNQENLIYLEKGLDNLMKHIENIQQVYQQPVVVAINRFPSDTEQELAMIDAVCRQVNVPVALSEVFTKGSAGGVDLAEKVLSVLQAEGRNQCTYEAGLPLQEKIKTIAMRVYGASEVLFAKNVEAQLAEFTTMGYGHYPICMAKTQYSLSDEPKRLGRPQNFSMTVRQVKLSAGAGFVVALTGDIMTMPGLPKVPSAEKIDVDSMGKITGLF